MHSILSILHGPNVQRQSLPVTATGVVNKANVKTCHSMKNDLWLILMVFSCSFWTQLTSSPRANILECYPGVLKTCQSLKMVFDGCTWFSLVLFEPSWQASPGQRSLNITPESWKAVSNWKMVFDGCTGFFLNFFFNPVGRLLYIWLPWTWIITIICGSLCNLKNWFFSLPAINSMWGPPLTSKWDKIWRWDSFGPLLDSC